jgi:hypothetical protein
VAHRFQAGEEFQQAGFMRRAMAEVRRDRRDETLGVVVHQRQQRIQPRLAAVAFHCGAAPGRRMHGFENTLEARGVGVLMR